MANFSKSGHRNFKFLPLAATARLGQSFDYSFLDWYHIDMSFILEKYTDPFVINGLLEGSAGVFALLLPQFFFYGTERNPHATYIARWWAAAVMAIGLTSLLVATRTCYILTNP